MVLRPIANAALSAWQHALVVLLVYLSILSIQYRIGKVGSDDFADSYFYIATPLDYWEWRKLDSQDWFRLSIQALENDNAEASKAYALRGLRQDISSGQLLTQLALVLKAQGYSLEAEKIASLAVRLASAEKLNSGQLLLLWDDSDRLGDIVAEWVKFIDENPAYKEIILSHLATLLFSPNAQPVFDKLVSSPPAWWPAFMNYLSSHSYPAEMLQALQPANP